MYACIIDFKHHNIFSAGTVTGGSAGYSVSSALDWLNKILNNKEVADFDYLYAAAKIFNLILHYELGNIVLLDYIVRSTYRYLKQRARLYRFEKLLLQFIKNKAPKITDRASLKSALKKIKEEFIAITVEEKERKVLEYFDFIAWLDSKLQDRPFADIIREKHRSRTVQE